jgi:hypothetical protein
MSRLAEYVHTWLIEYPGNVKKKIDCTINNVSLMCNITYVNSRSLNGDGIWKNQGLRGELPVDCPESRKKG